MIEFILTCMGAFVQVFLGGFFWMCFIIVIFGFVYWIQYLVKGETE